ncbi:uncharacterized protein [Amphiura filiformis]|uniref:uncharacterized protein n=1 Tax=Amphiura filiformis TaxID=82378 RepID=UPI003B223BD7
MAKSRIDDVMPFDYDIEVNAADQILPSSLDSNPNLDEQTRLNPSQNSNAKRTQNSYASGSRPNSSPQDQEQLFQIIRQNSDLEEMDLDHEYNLRPITRANLIHDRDDFKPISSKHTPRSAGAIRLLPHPTQAKYKGNHIFGPSRIEEQDILAEWRNAGLIKHGGGGVAFEVALKANSNRYAARFQRQRRTHRLTSLHLNRHEEDVKNKLDEKLRKASERRKRTQSEEKERLANQIHERKKQAKEKYEEDEDYKQRVTHMKIIEKQSKCAVNREKRETEFRKRMEKRRRKRDKTRKRAKRPLRYRPTNNDDQREKHDKGHSDGTDNKDDRSDDDDEEDVDRFAESSPQLPKYHLMFD